MKSPGLNAREIRDRVVLSGTDSTAAAEEEEHSRKPRETRERQKRTDHEE